MIDLVEQRARLECVGGQDAFGPELIQPAHRDLCRAPHVRGEVREGKATLPGDLGPRRAHDDRVEEDDQSVVGPSFGVVADVDDDAASQHADLVGGETDASFVRSHGVDEVLRQLPCSVIDVADGQRHLFEDWIRIDPNRADHACSMASLEDVRLALVEDDIDTHLGGHSAQCLLELDRVSALGHLELEDERVDRVALADETRVEVGDVHARVR